MLRRVLNAKPLGPADSCFLDPKTAQNQASTIGSVYLVYTHFLTSCRWAAATICLRSLQVDSIFVFIRQVAPVSACWLFKSSATNWPLTFFLP